MGAFAFVTFWDNDAGSKIHLLANPGQDVAPIGVARQEDSLLESHMQLGSLQHPHNPTQGVGALPLPLGPRRRLRGLPAPQLHRGLPDRARAQDAPERCQHPFGRPGLVHFQGARRHDDGRVQPPDSLSTGDALWHWSFCAGLAWIHSSIGRGATTLKLGDRGLDSTRARKKIYLASAFGNSFFPSTRDGSSETDLSTSNPVTASPGNKKFPRRIFPPPAQFPRHIFRSKTDPSASSPVTASPGNKKLPRQDFRSETDLLTSSPVTASPFPPPAQ